MTMQLNYQGAALPIAQAVAHMVDVAEAEYREQSGGAQREPWLQFLPPADLNKRSKQVWMLPNLTSFTSIYARMNRYYGHRLAGIHLVHDQQLEIEGILRGGKATAEQLSRTMDLPYTPQSDYRFEEQASLHFNQSHETVGLQLADVVAGATMRFYRDADTDALVPSELREAIMRLIAEGDERTGYGLNQVVPTANVRSVGYGVWATSAREPKSAL